MKRNAGCWHARWFMLTVTGKTLAENLAEVEELQEGQQVTPFDAPVKKDSHLVVLKGNLSPTGAG